MWSCVGLVLTDVSEEHIVSIFRVEKSASEEPVKTPGSQGFVARGFFFPEDGDDKFLRNVGSHKIYTVPYPR
jgi:hypothetical protein